MKKYIFFLLLAFAQLLFLSSCGEKNCNSPYNPECPNYDPCYNQKPATAAFKILETYGAYNEFWQDYETDTIIGGYTKFTADFDLEDAQYEWIIGAGTYTTRSVNLSFPIVADRTTIPITLIVKKQPNKQCNPSDDGIDTLTKNICIRNVSLVMPGRDTIKFRGSYKDSPRDTFTISSFYDLNRSEQIIGNLVKGTGNVPFTCYKAYRQAIFDTNAGMSCAGRAFLKPNDSIEIYFRYQLRLSDPETSKTFIGKKIQ